jgi:hypothetical protein
VAETEMPIAQPFLFQPNQLLFLFTNGNNSQQRPDENTAPTTARAEVALDDLPLP